MTVRTYVECEGPHCDASVVCGSDEQGSWYEVWRNRVGNFSATGDATRFDFCSLPCVTAWATSREIVRAAS